MDSFRKRLTQLDAELKAPKNMYNNFGKYNYRNAESILEAVKPLLVKYSMNLTICDDIKQVGDRYYLMAIATIQDTESTENVFTTAYAREPIDKKGMDESQITGTASSYARKYALNGLFLLDDTKDADTDEYHESTKPKTSKKEQPKKEEPKTEGQTAPVLIGEKEVELLKAMMVKANVTEAQVLSLYKVNELGHMNQALYTSCMTKLQNTIDAHNYMKGVKNE